MGLQMSQTQFSDKTATSGNAIFSTEFELGKLLRAEPTGNQLIPTKNLRIKSTQNKTKVRDFHS